MNVLPTFETEWLNALRDLESEVPKNAFQAWINPMRFESFSNGVLTVSVSDSFSRNWVIKHHEEAILDAFARHVGERPRLVEYRLESLEQDAVEDEQANGFPGGETGAAFPVNGHHGHTVHNGHSGYNGETNRHNGSGGNGFMNHHAAASVDADNPAHVPQGMVAGASLTVIPLKPDHTFENFIVGESNRFANAAAMAVADPQSRVYNPLFLYGGSGLGKTHLMHAIGHRMLSIARNAKVLYVTSEIFMNAFIQGVQQKDLNEFRNLFRNVDLLMIDDIETLVGKERSQVEFFHTFHTLFQEGNKIVISSDVPPKELTELEERLRTRFQEGLIVDIQPPELETRVAILLKKARDRGLNVPPEVGIYIAERMTSSVRQLEGAVNRLELHTRMNMGPITIDSARTLLKDLFSGEEPVKISVEKVQSAVCSYFGISMHELTGANRSRKYTVPRHLAAYLARELTNVSFPELARKFGGRDHTSIMHSHRKVQAELVGDLNKQNLVRHLTRMIKDEPHRRDGM